MAKANDLTIHVGKQTLSDGSEVFNVYLGDECKNPFPAYSEKDAHELAETLSSAINHHSLTQAAVKAW